MPRPSDTEATFEIDERLYPLEAVQNAIYTYTDRAYVRVEPAGAGKLTVVMTFKPAATPAVRGELRGEFDNELIHQALRLRVSEANQKIREFIVTKALVSAQPAELVASGTPAAPPAESCPDCDAAAAQGNSSAPAHAPIDEALEKEIDRLLAEIESGDGASDPLGVAVPWEEKFGKKKASGEVKPVKAKEPAKKKAAAKLKVKSA